MSELRVQRVELSEWRSSLAASNARQRWTDRKGLIVGLGAEGGLGRGEASPLPGYSDETLEEVKAEASALRADDLRIDLSAPYASVQRCVSAIPRRLPSLRFAVEAALLDLSGQALGVPAHRLLAQPSVSKRVAEVITELEGGLEQGRLHVQAGARALKLKVGRPGLLEAERDLVKSLRAEHPNVELRVDANQAWGRQAAASARIFAALGVAYIEEPGPPEGWTSAMGPLAFDETLRRPDAEAVLTRYATEIRALVLKPAVLGGIEACLAWARRGRLLVPNLDLVASHLFDGPIAAAATRTLACVLPGRGEDGSSPAQGLGFLRGGGAEIQPGQEPGLLGSPE